MPLGYRRDAIDIVIVGAGLNGLVAAAALGRAGFKTLVVERGGRIGGALATSEIAPGFRVPALAHRVMVDPEIVRALGLVRQGLQIVRPRARVLAPLPDAPPLTLWDDPRRAVESIAILSRRDADRYPEFLASFRAVATVLHSLLGSPAPPIDHVRAGDLFSFLRTARRFRALSPADAHRLLRWITMSVADLVHEWFDSEPLGAAIGAGGVLGSFLGPRSAGSAAVLMVLSAAERHPLAVGWTARGGPGAVAESVAQAARASGVELRTGAPVVRITVDRGTATGIVLASGEEIAATHVVSNLDPRRTLVTLVDPGELSPEIVRRVQDIRTRGTLAKVNYAVSRLPSFAGLDRSSDQGAALSGAVRLAPDLDAIERAFDAVKYGRFADEPWIELSIPSIADDTLAPAGQHVVSAYVQFAPFPAPETSGASADQMRARIGSVATRTIERYAPGFEASIVARQVITPADLESTLGLSGGHMFHAELALDQLVVGRPLLGWARYQTPIRNLWLCGSGTHPGTGADGRSGALAARAIIRGAK
jgi:phytoene dehydrogenase-like protein